LRDKSKAVLDGQITDSSSGTYSGEGGIMACIACAIDAEPHVFVDEIGEKIIGEENWRARADMAPEFSKSMRASVTGRARFIEDIVEEKVNEGVTQYVILGAGIDTFAQRRGDLASRLQVFEVDQSASEIFDRYFAGRSDGLRAGDAEAFLVAST
jgi:hypothetical protein